MPEYTITVNCEQSAGVYKLAEIADEFAGAITVQNVLGESLGKLNLGNTIQVDGTDYTLSLDDSTLTLAVKGPDTTAPIVSNIQSSISSLTNQDVILTAEFADDLDLAQSLYKLGDTGEWTTYQGGVTVTENTNVFFKAIDAAGNESEVASCEVTNIDKTPPETPVAAADVTTPTNVDVLVTAEFSEDSVIKQYSLDGKNWGTYPGGILFGTNLTVYFRGIDAAGNISEVAGYTVTNVDRSAPVITLTGDNQTPTNKATLTASVDDGSKLYYSKDDSGWTEYKTPITVWDNASYSFRATDEAGNTGISEIVFANIEKAVVAKPLFFEGDFNGDDCDMFAVKETDGSTVTICADGALWGAGLELDPGWEIAGVGDFGGDGFDDFLRVHASGLVMGDMSSGNGLFNPQVLNFLNEGWDILGVGDFNGNGTDDVLIANPTAASETVGLLGYWESGTTWTLINGYSAEWECVATGDYNGDGKCDMLWRNSFEGEGGGTYNAYCTWIVDNPVDWRMVSVANPAEWNFLCSGDFDGDKMNDIAMINDVGVVGIWGVNDGWLSSWSILSAVTPEWQLAGVADFNGDGTDDIAWANADTGLVGCWQIENKELASWQTIANLG